MWGHSEQGARLCCQFLLVVSLPELHGPGVGCDEDDAAQEGAQGCGEDGGGEGLEEEHGRVCEDSVKADTAVTAHLTPAPGPVSHNSGPPAPECSRS